jgi:hypothetical protein
MNLKQCGKNGCRPVEQTRGQMGHGDYADVIASHRHVVPNPAQSFVDMESSHDLHTLVEMDESAKNDFRVCCMKCGKTTPWQMPDAPGMPGVGIDYTRKRWAQMLE